MANLGKKLTSRLGIVGELMQFLWQNKLWWMIPIIITLIVLGVFVWFAQSAAVPFIYTLF